MDRTLFELKNDILTDSLAFTAVGIGFKIAHHLNHIGFLVNDLGTGLITGGLCLFGIFWLLEAMPKLYQLFTR